jgi:hypothetical protein
MLQPITVAPIFACDSSTTFVLSLTSPPFMPNWSRKMASANAHSCSFMPPTPSGFATLWLGPATKPSSDIEIVKRNLDTFFWPLMPDSGAPLEAGPELPDSVDQQRGVRGTLLVLGPASVDSLLQVPNRTGAVLVAEKLM